MTKELLELDHKQYGIAYTPAKVDFPDYDLLKKQVDSLKDEFTQYDVTPSNLTSAKTARAQLNKFDKAINDKKIEIVKKANAPIINFEAQIKELLGEVKEASKHIGDQINTYETKARDERHKQNIVAIKRIAKEMELDSEEAVTYVLPIYNSSWDNKTYSYKKFEEEIKQRLRELIEIKCAKKEAYEVITARAKKLRLLADKYIDSYEHGKELKKILNDMDYERNYLSALAKKQAGAKKREQTNLQKHGDKAINPKTGEIKDRYYNAILETKNKKIKITGTKYQFKQLMGCLKDMGFKCSEV